MKSFCALVVVFASCVAPAQTEVQDAPLKLYQYRVQSTKPMFGLKTVEELIHRHNLQLGMPLPDGEFDSLSQEEKFTYVMVHGEEFNQNCSGFPMSSQRGRKIFSTAPVGLEDSDESRWSDRQIKFLHKNRARVIELLRDTIRDRKRVGVNLKMAIEEVDAREMIPDMLGVFDRDRKDLDILTVCLVLMKDGHYGPFLNSSAFQKLYGRHANVGSFLEPNSINTEAIESMSMAYYRSFTP